VADVPSFELISLQPALLKTRLVPSMFGMGMFNDTLIIEPFSDQQAKRELGINPLLMQAFIEGVLGYRLVDQNVSTAVWDFRKEGEKN
jgi:hypothetical protein